jgi:hypothetical protein
MLRLPADTRGSALSALNVMPTSRFCRRSRQFTFMESGVVDLAQALRVAAQGADGASLLSGDFRIGLTPSWLDHRRSKPPRSQAGKRIISLPCALKRTILPRSFSPFRALPNDAGEALERNKRATRICPVP